MKMMHEKQQQRWQEVENYTVTMSMEAAMGMQTMVYNERLIVEGSVTFRQIPKPVYERDMQIQAGFPPPEETSANMAEGLKMIAPNMKQGGLESTLDWDGMIAFAEAGAVAYDSISDGTDEATMEVKHKRMLLQRAELVGVEQVQAASEGNKRSSQTREAYHIKADDLGDIELEQPKDGGDYQMRSFNWWIDTEEYVMLAFEMNGEVDNKGNRTPITIGGKNLDYRQVGPLYQPYTNIYQISGLMEGMSEKDRKKMEKAKADMAEQKAAFEKMPPEQQALMKKMMGNKFEEMENMLHADNIQTRVNVSAVAINEGPPTPYGLGSVDQQPALTIAMEDIAEDGSLVGKIEISVGPLAERGELKLVLVGEAPFMMPDETINIITASGFLTHNNKQVKVVAGTGSITIDYRSETHIRGTYTVDLEHAAGPLPTINGTFKSPPPLPPGQAPMGSPIPAGLFSEQD
jgi:hypothetical protein